MARWQRYFKNLHLAEEIKGHEEHLRYILVNTNHAVDMHGVITRYQAFAIVCVTCDHYLYNVPFMKRDGSWLDLPETNHG